MKKKFSLFICVCLLVQLFSGTVSAVSIDQFRDVKEHWAKSYIEILCDKGIINGYGNGTFAPNGTLTKAEAAKLVCLSAGITPSESVSVSIKDLGQHWAKQYIAVLPSVPLDENNFYPDKSITRAEFAQMAVGAMYLDTTNADTSSMKTKFKDWATIPEDKLPCVALAVEKGIISGYEDSTFKPNNTLTRAEACTILKRAFFPNEKLKPSAYYIDTIVNVSDVTSLIVTPDKTVYYATENKVYSVSDNKSTLLWDANTASVMVTLEDIENQPDSGIREFSKDRVGKIAESHDCPLEFKKFQVSGIVYDSSTGDVYAHAYSESAAGTRGINLMVLVNLKGSQDIRAKIISCDANSSPLYSGMPNGASSLMYNGSVFYSTNNDRPSYMFNSGKTYRWDISSNRITEYTDFVLWKCNAVFKNDEIWYIPPSTGLYSSDIIKYSLTTTSSDKFELYNDIIGTMVGDTFACGDDIYFWRGKNMLYRISISDLNPELILDSGESGGFSPNIIAKDGLNFKLSDHLGDFIWTADSEGTIYFYDSSNKAIRKLYGA